MKAIGRWSVASLLRCTAQFARVIMLAATVITAALFTVTFITGGLFQSVGFPAYLNAGAYIYGLRGAIESGSVLMQSVSEVKPHYSSLRNLSLSSVLPGLSQIGLMAYTLYTLAVLKIPLNAIALNKWLKPKGRKDLRKVALLILFATPLTYGYE